MTYSDGNSKPSSVLYKDKDGSGRQTTRIDVSEAVCSTVAEFNRTNGTALHEALIMVRASLVSALPPALAGSVAKAAGTREAGKVVRSNRLGLSVSPDDDDIPNPDQVLPPWDGIPGSPGDPFGAPPAFLLCETPFSCALCLSVCVSAGEQARRGCDALKPGPFDPPDQQQQWLDCINQATRTEIICGLLCL
jgi:hypothetical protein